ncbi:CoA transferase [Candidimonas sp. SYP-B2681]|uniref:CaiB/BaiF CoA transferase family protein n=1 Tax=Candidimonas sp. SYP-B2681 TaxID=2497686 RepID=UPI000F866BDA|nr:CaiB/BaiF CoA-transferase family protein [Candidimonas sp. SYP-B2681]RTZ43209.1 CoA transferase [Candidimonas sp. SYP-B2681]
MSGVLSGVRVVELGTFITGPAAGVLLADLGADVIKVEKTGTGDPFRTSPDGSLFDANFQAFNRNKRSIALNTSLDDDLGVFDELIRSADVFIQNFRPGAAERMNVGEDRLRAVNPQLIYCSITGFGSDGPGASRPCYDTVAQAASGYLDLTLNPENPRVLGPAVADSITGLYAAYGILGALFERNKTGHGKAVEVSMVGSMMHFNIDSFTHYFANSEKMQPYSRPAASQAHVLTCKDGLRVALHMSSPPKFWDNLIQALELPQINDDPRFKTREQRILHHTELIQTLREVFVQRSLDEWCRRLSACDVPHAPVYDAPSALADPQAQHLQVQITADHPIHGAFTTIRNPVAYDRAFTQTLRSPPRLDEHREEILATLAQSRPTN